MNRTLFAQAKSDACASGNCENATGVAVDLRYTALFQRSSCPVSACRDGGRSPDGAAARAGVPFAVIVVRPE